MWTARLNPRKLEDNVVRYSKYAGGGAGRACAFRTANAAVGSRETREVLQAAVNTAAAEKVLTAGIVRDSVHGAIELIEYAAV